MDDDAVGITALDHEMPQRFADVSYEAVKVVIAIAVKVLEHTFVVEAKGAFYVSFSVFFRLERSDSEDYVIALFAGLQQPRNTAYLGKDGSLDVRQMEL